MKLIKLVFSVMFIFISYSPSFVNAQDSSDLERAVIVSEEFNQRGYFIIRQDFRRCVYPLCGGYWISKVNRSSTRCADGSRQKECYVAILNWRMLGFDPMLGVDGHSVLLRGKIGKKKFPKFGNLGKFIAKDAYHPVGERVKNSLYVGLEKNGIVCITSPCFSFDERILNRQRIRSISGIDLSSVDASEEDLAEANEIIANGGVLLSAGMTKQVEELGRLGINYRANQLFLPFTK